MKKITDFKEIVDWIWYDWDSNYTLKASNNGKYFYVNKLCITPTHLEYKTERYELEEGLYDRVIELYKVISGDKAYGTPLAKTLRGENV